jgi:allantoinase
MPAPTFVIRGQQVVFADAVRPAAIHIRGGVITAIASYETVLPDSQLFEAGLDSLVMPGLVDTHVHINEPGRTDWEGFSTATRAAAAGGVTTLIDMPLNSIPATTSLPGLQAKLAAARDQCYVDVGFWGGVVPGNQSELAPLLAHGVVGFKCFLIHSGVDEFPNVTEADLRVTLPVLKQLGALLIVHAEVPGPISRTGISACHPAAPGSNAPSEEGDYDAASYQTFLASRPRAAEDEAVALMIHLAREFGTRVHIVHHSSADSLPLLNEAKASGLAITAETCPHYLALAAEDIPNGATEFKCCPPIRERENREQLWRALADGVIDMIVSDHSPCPPELKLRASGDFLCAWGGISSLQLRLPLVWTEARRRGHSLSEVTRWLCHAPAQLVGLDQRKGSIAVGHDADLVIWNPAREFKVKGAALEHRHKLTPYEGLVLSGVVEQTFLRGEKVYDEGEFVTRPRGVLL